MAAVLSTNFDAAGGIELHQAAVAALAAAAEDGWADPGRLSGPGRRSAVLLQAARQSTAELLGVRADEVIFLSSAAHALQAAVLGLLASRTRIGPALVHSAVEHSTVLHAARWHEARGGQVQVVGVDEYGQVDAADFVDRASAPGVAAAVLQAANHEVGTRQPVTEVAAALAPLGVELIVDATHDILYGPVPTASLFTLDARLWGGPGGVGVLVVRSGSRWRAPWPTDESEAGRGLGLANVVNIVAAAAALRAHFATRVRTGEHLAALTEHLRRQLPALVDDIAVLGHPTDRLPHLVAFSVLYASGERLLGEFDRRGFAVSSGSSCTSDALTPSHVLVAMKALSSGNIRVSLPPRASSEAVEEFLAVLPAVTAAVRAEHPDTQGNTATGNTARGADVDAGEHGDLILDSRGRRCPLPILDLARALPDIAVGHVLTVLADDPAADSDIAAWCRMRGQQLVDSSDYLDGPIPTGRAYRVRRLR